MTPPATASSGTPAIPGHTLAGVGFCAAAEPPLTEATNGSGDTGAANGATTAVVTAVDASGVVGVTVTVPSPLARKASGLTQRPRPSRSCRRRRPVSRVVPKLRRGLWPWKSRQEELGGHGGNKECASHCSGKANSSGEHGEALSLGAYVAAAWAAVTQTTGTMVSTAELLLVPRSFTGNADDTRWNPITHLNTLICLSCFSIVLP